MTDKVQKIRKEVARIQLYTQSEVLKQILDYIDKVQEEPVKIKKGCKYRCLSDMVNKDTGNISFIGDKIYLAPKDNTLVTEENGWLCDTSENASNFELVEEPVSSIWHDASEKSNEPEEVVIINPSDNTGEVLTRCTDVYQGRIWAYTSELLKLANPCKIGKNLQEEPVSEELEEASKEWLKPQLDKSYANYGEAKMMELTRFDGYAMLDAIEFGAKWQKEKLWKPADGDDLPEIDREVIVLLDNGKVVYAHRPPEYWDGKNIVTGKVTRNYPKTYDKGGWNIPNVKWWLDVELPKEIEL